MSYFLKRTKKSCLKLLHKISPSKLLFVNKLDEEEDEESSNHINGIDILDDTQTNALKKCHVKIINREKFVKNQNVSIPNCENEIDAELDLQQYSFIDEAQNNNTILNSLTSKLLQTADGFEFRRLQQLSSDATSEVIQIDPELDALVETVFEKVKFKKHVRYLQHTPSNSSLDNSSATNNMSLIPDRMYIATKAVTSEDSLGNECSYSQSVSKYQLQAHRTAHSTNIQFLPINVGFGSRSDENYQSVIISEGCDFYDKLSPVIRWDINGNSFTDDEELFINDNWEGFKSRQNYIYENSANTDDSQKSSRQSSSSTLETWLEEEFL